MKILIAEDSILIRILLVKLFEEKLNFTVVAQANNGVEAIEMYNEYLPDLITLDINMPVLNGIEALKTILKNHPSAKVIIISALKQNDDIITALELGAKAYITKPIMFEDPDYINQFKEDVFDALGISQ